MSKESPFEDMTPIQNIKVGYLEKKEYLRIIDEQRKQIDGFAYTIMALQSRIETLEKSRRPRGEWVEGYHDYFETLDCSECGYVRDDRYKTYNFCPTCGADMRKEGKNDK